MRLHHYVCPGGNFGDDLNAWLWPQLLGEIVDDDPRSLFVGIGTLLNESLPREPLKAVFGSGVGYGPTPAVDETWRVYCVRGPRSAAALGLAEDAAVTDAALLLRLVMPPRSSGPSGNVVFVPHHTSTVRAQVEGLDISGVCDELGIRYVDPAGAPSTVLEMLSGADVVIAEAMHAAIAADALRVPWVAVALYDHVHELKWLDWCESLNLAYAPSKARGHRTASTVADLLRQALTAAPSLSRTSDSDRALARLEERLEGFRGHVREGRFAEGGSVPAAAASTPATDDWAARIVAAAAAVEARTGPADTILLADGGEWMVDGTLRGRRAIPVTEHAGKYNGPPHDDDHAVDEIERLRGAGADFLAVTSAARWWLDLYPRFARYLRETYTCVLETPDVVLFDLAQVEREETR